MDYPNPSRNATGFTLIEIVITLVLLGIISAVTIQFVASAAEVGQIQTERNQLVNEARLAMEAMVREIRFAVPASVVVTPVSITFDKQFPYLQDPSVAGIDYTYNPATRVIQRTGIDRGHPGFGVCHYRQCRLVHPQHDSHPPFGG